MEVWTQFVKQRMEALARTSVQLRTQALPRSLNPFPLKEVLIFDFLMFKSIESLCVCEHHPFHAIRIKVDTLGAKGDIHELRKMHLNCMLGFI